MRIYSHMLRKTLVTFNIFINTHCVDKVAKSEASGAQTALSKVLI